MHRSSIFNIKIDFDKSHDSYIFDKNRNKFFLDFFGLYSTLPLGYSHPIFKHASFRNDYNRIAGVKVTNCEIISDEAEDFLQEFSGHKDMKNFKYFHFCCTGALAIEASIKIAMDQKKCKKPTIISFKESFHGINSYGGFATDRFFPVSQRLQGFPFMDWPKVHNPKIIYKDNLPDAEATQRGLEQFKREFDLCIEKYGANNIVALLVEPIQATYGDNYFLESFFKLIRRLCDKYNICIIFDEIQCGFGVTGKMWFYQHLDMEPDIIVFGKKTQVSGAMAKEKFNMTFQTPIRLEVTWDGNLVDMIRAKYILRAYDKENILDNVNKQGKKLAHGLKKLPRIKNIRSKGLLIAFDFDTSRERDAFCSRAFQNRLLISKANIKTVRLRSNLNISNEECDQGLELISKSLREISYV